MENEQRTGALVDGHPGMQGRRELLPEFGWTRPEGVLKVCRHLITRSTTGSRRGSISKSRPMRVQGVVVRIRKPNQAEPYQDFRRRDLAGSNGRPLPSQGTGIINQPHDLCRGPFH